MHEDLNQKISQFLDNELDQDEALSILQKMQLQPDLKNKMIRYEAISHALKTDMFLCPGPDFSTKISQQILHEPFYLLPKNHPITEHQPIKRSNKMLALAASVAVVAIIAAQGVNQSEDNKFKTSSTIQLAQQPVVEPSSTPTTYPHQNEQYPINARINDYLQAHNTSVYTNGEANFRPFARVSAHSQE
jgi:sigma-E factor negative regulatory protein RseA